MSKVNATSGCTIDFNYGDYFGMLTQEELSLLEESSVVVDYKKGEHVCKQGTFASNIIFIEQGLVKMFIENNTNSLTLKIIPKNNLVGLTTLFDGDKVYQYSVVTYQDSKIRLIDIEVFRQILQKNTAFSYKIINVLCGEIIQTNGRFFSLTNKQSFGRLADLILCLSVRIYKSDSFELLLSRKELAELSGLSTESVIRIIKKFKDDGLIKITGKLINILDQEKLQDISDYG